MIKENKGFLPPKPAHHKVWTSDNCFRVGYEKVKSPFDENGPFNNRSAPDSDSIKGIRQKDHQSKKRNLCSQFKAE